LALDINELTDPMERVEQVLAQTPRRRGADLVIEATGIPSAVDESMRLARRNGIVLVLGQYTDKGFAALNPHLITRKQLTMRGSWAFGPKHYLEYVRSLDSLSSRFQLNTLVTTYDLADVNTALKDMRSGDTIKPVLICQRNP
jgi:threonine dehydrogenase-like Zn-dependent dehydrogenase